MAPWPAHLAHCDTASWRVGHVLTRRPRYRCFHWCSRSAELTSPAQRTAAAHRQRIRAFLEFARLSAPWAAPAMTAYAPALEKSATLASASRSVPQARHAARTVRARTRPRATRSTKSARCGKGGAQPSFTKTQSYPALPMRSGQRLLKGNDVKWEMWLAPSRSSCCAARGRVQTVAW